MAKTVEQKSKDWGCSSATVRKYCASGLIPPAEKVGRMHKWMIPDEWPKPPMSRHGLCFLLDTIYQISSGVEYKAIKWGYSREDVIAGFEYLIGAVFMSTIDTNNLENELGNAFVTPRGEALIEKENSEGGRKIKYTARLKGKASFGIGSLEAEGELSNE